MKMLVFPSLLLLAGLVPLGAGGPRIQAPDAPWKTLRTAHYALHFPAGGDFQPFAQEVASKIEGIHAQVTEWVGFEYPEIVHVVIRDPQLDANGSAWPFRDRPWVELWKTPPEPDSVIGHYTSWVDLVVTHELAHIHHLMRPQNRPAWTDRVLDLPVGPVTRKAPRWVIEGYATVIEGRITGSGRPHGAYRASLLRQWALQGKLPDYGALSGVSGFRGGSMAYLVGSAYLEWLERQNPADPDLLKKLWKQLASRKRRAFDQSFKATFGMDPRDGYDRWRAEVTHDALELERRARKQNLLREGELWARFDGEVTDLAVSPDGSRLLARILTKDFKGLRVWELAGKAPPEPPKHQKEAAPDPNEVEDLKPTLPNRKPMGSLGRVEGSVPEKPHWSGAGQVLFSLRQWNEEGILERNGFEWSLAVPSGVRRAPAASAESPGATPKEYEAVPDALSWTLYRRGPGAPRPLTRTLSVALSPAPTPDGKWLFYTQLTATGMDIRKLDLSLPPLEAATLNLDPEPLSPDTVISRADEPSRLPAPSPPPPARDYQVGDALWNRGRSGLSVGPSGESYQFGYGGTDLVGRFAWLAMGSVGNGAGPRGAAMAAAWRGWRWAPSLALFSSLERPSAQAFQPIPGFDRERRGAEVALTYASRNRTPATFRPFVAHESVEDLGTRTTVNRALAGLQGSASRRWQTGERLAFTLSAAASAASGRTDGQAWNLQRGQVALRFAQEALPLALKGGLARLGGAPTALDRLRLGGVEASLVPATLDLNRFLQPALPVAAQTGDRARSWRGEVGAGLRAYLEHTQIWTSGQPRPSATRVAGLEAALHEYLPFEQAVPLLGHVELTLGLHRPLDGLMKGRTVGTLSLIVRP